MAPAQVDLGGASHALQFLEQLSPHVHVFTHAAMFRNAVWLPYRWGICPMSFHTRMLLHESQCACMHD